MEELPVLVCGRALLFLLHKLMKMEALVSIRLCDEITTIVHDKRATRLVARTEAG